MAFILKNDKKETENKTIRFPINLINQIERSIENTEVSFSGFVIQACEYALKELKPSNKNSEIPKVKQ